MMRAGHGPERWAGMLEEWIGIIRERLQGRAVYVAGGEG
jgi:hypothetical protein